MNTIELVLGIDTSNYTTSMSAVSREDGRLISDARRLLPVTQGERGLRQSDALFFHVQQLSEVMSELMSCISSGDVRWRGVGVSVRPRPLASSYMPVFLAGSRFAETLALLSGIPLVRTSHQEGHLAAADYDLSLCPDHPVLAVHLSGGTSDVLYATRTRFGYDIETLGSSSDLNAGQFVDRVGVALGMPFPAGAHLERLLQARDRGSAESLDHHCAGQGLSDGRRGVQGHRLKEPFRLSATVHGADMSFSGPCSAALRAIDSGICGEEVTSAVFSCIANSLVKAVTYAHRLKPHVRTCVLVGGVMANTFIRTRVEHRLSIIDPELRVLFAEPRFSSDNALGVAHIARRFLQEV